MLKLTKIVNALENAKHRLEIKRYEVEDFEREEIEEEIYAIEEALYLLKEYE